MDALSRFVLEAEKPLPLPVLSLPGARLAGRSHRDFFTDSDCQVAAAIALRDSYGTVAWQSAMDLSVEAEEFGCEIRFAEDESPSILGRLVTDLAGAENLPVPKAGSGRSAVCLKTLRALASDASLPFAVGGIIGPFSLAGRIYGLSEAMLGTVMEPDTLKILLGKASEYIVSYAIAQKEAGAKAIIMAEPSAGLLSPEGLAEFSGTYVRRIVDAVQGPDFGIILHNCAATPAHLPAIYACGARGYHFGAPMDMAAAMDSLPKGAIAGGNLDPSRAFCALDAEGMRAAVKELRARVGKRPGFFLSSGCDIPAEAPDATIRAFFEAAWG